MTVREKRVHLAEGKCRCEANGMERTGIETLSG